MTRIRSACIVRDIIAKEDELMLDFEPDEQHTVSDMANVGYALMQAIKEHRPDYCWNDSPAEIVGDLCNELAECSPATTANTDPGVTG